MAQLVIALADALDLGDHVEKTEQSQNSSEHQQNCASHFSRTRQPLPLHLAYDFPQQGGAIQNLKLYFFRAAGQQQKRAHRIAHAACGAQKPADHRGQVFALLQAFQAQFQHLEPALHDRERRAQFVTHIARKMAFTLHKTPKRLLAGGNGAGQHADLVIHIRHGNVGGRGEHGHGLVGRRVSPQAGFRAARGLGTGGHAVHSRSGTPLHRQGEPPQRIRKTAAQNHGQKHRHGQPRQRAEQQDAVEAMGRSIVDGTAAQDEEGNYIVKDGLFVLEGFGVPSAENCSFALAAAIERVRGTGGAGGKVTIPADLRDAAVASLCEFLAGVGVPAAGLEMYSKLAKSYYSRNVTASLTPEAIKLTAARIDTWFNQLDEDDKVRFSLVQQRWQDKAKEAAEPKTVELGIL